MTCKDCIHEKICDHFIPQGLPWGDGEFPAELFCDLFKPKSRFIVLPCAVGDTVYRVMRDKRIKQPYQYKVIGVWYSADETCNNLHLVRYVNGMFDSSISVPFSEFNRILFLTKEEAEKALERSEGR